MVHCGGVTDFLPFPFFEFEISVQLRDIPASQHGAFGLAVQLKPWFIELLCAKF